MSYSGFEINGGKTKWTYASVNVSVFSFCQCVQVGMCGPRRMIVFKTHLLGESGSSLTLMQSQEVRINTKYCNTGLGERQDSLFIAVDP